MNGETVRRSLGLRSLEGAQKLVREWEVRGVINETPGASVHDACERFYADCEARKLSAASLGKYKLLTEELKKEFLGRPVASLSVSDLRSYREGWLVAAVTARKKLERLRTFFRFCHESGWIQSNPAKLLRSPVETSKPTLPLTPAEFEKLLWGTEVFSMRGSYGEGNRIRLRAFILLLRYSGLRIRDAAMLSEDKLDGNKLFLYTQKTGVPVRLPLPQHVLKELKRAKELSPNKYFFWSGNGTPKSAVTDWQRSISRLSLVAGVRFHAHRLRDTFAVELLQKGVSIENVSVLLGHSNVLITQKHYTPWVKSRQIALEASIKKAWKLS